jgi:hypothetical protein
MRAGVWLAVVGAVGLAGAQAMAQDAPSFPPSLDHDALLAWLQRETDITPERVVAVTPQAITAVVSTFPAGAGQGPRVVIRAEALNGETYARTGALSWHVSLSADCTGHRVRLGDTTGYPERNLLGERRVLRPAETEWRAPEAGTALDNAWRAACDGKFKGPFQSSDVKVVQQEAAAPPPAASPPAPTPVAPAPAAPAPVPPPKPAPPKPAPKSPPASPTAAPAMAAPAGAVSVQIGSFPDQASANAALKTLGDGQPHATESAVVAGRTWYRAVVNGFASGEAANQYCEARRAKGGVCLVRVRSR